MDWATLRRPALFFSLFLSTIITILIGIFVVLGSVRENALKEEKMADFKTQLGALIGIYDYQGAELFMRSYVQNSDLEATEIFDTSQTQIVAFRDKNFVLEDQSHEIIRAELFAINLSGRLRSVGYVVMYIPNTNILAPYISTLKVGFIVFFVTLLIIMLSLRHYISLHVARPISELSKAMTETLRTGEHVPAQVFGPSLVENFAHLFNDFVEELNDNKTKLHDAKKLEAIAHLTGSVAHEFNNFLAVILGNIDLILSRGDLQDDLIEKLTIAKNNALSAGDIVAQLLSYSRETINPQLDTLDIGSHLSELTASSDLYTSSRTTLNIENQAGNIRVQHGSQTRSAVMNLIKNASEALKGKPGGKVDVTASLGSAEKFDLGQIPGVNTFLKIEVRDNGPGVAPSIRDRLFEPFVTTKKSGRGTGLGLWATCNFARSVGGAFRYEPNEPQGSVFSLIVPLEERIEIGSKNTLSPAAEQPIKNKSILIVEDEPELLIILEQHFKGLGNQVDIALDVCTAKTLISHKRYDVLISDYCLSDGDGAEVVNEFVTLGQDGVRILMSGNFQDAHTETHNFDALLNKPVSLEELSVVVSNLLSSDMSTDIQNSPATGVQIRPPLALNRSAAM